jgi:histidine triad (HIT) family protein
MTEPTDSVFSKIIRGEIPCHRVYEDDLTIAFLDVNPIARGHVLVVPKEPAVTLPELSDASAAAIGRVLPRICRAVMKVTGAGDCNILQNNGRLAHQAVPHVHFHVIPKTEHEGLGITWPAKPLDRDAGAELGRQLARLL